MKFTYLDVFLVFAQLSVSLVNLQRQARYCVTLMLLYFMDFEVMWSISLINEMFDILNLNFLIFRSHPSIIQFLSECLYLGAVVSLHLHNLLSQIRIVFCFLDLWSSQQLDLAFLSFEVTRIWAQLEITLLKNLSKLFKQPLWIISQTVEFVVELYHHHFGFGSVISHFFLMVHLNLSKCLGCSCQLPLYFQLQLLDLVVFRLGI